MSATSNFIFSGDAVPINVEAARSKQLIAQMEGIHQHSRAQTKESNAAAKIQSVIRMCLARRRYRRHCTEQQTAILRITEVRKALAAMAIQRRIKGMQARFRRSKLKAEFLAQRAAAAAGKGKGKGKGAAAAPATSTYSTVGANLQFIGGLRAYLAGRYDEAAQYFDSQCKTFGGPDPVSARMIERSKRNGAPIVASAAAAVVAAPTASGKGGAKAKGKK